MRPGLVPTDVVEAPDKEALVNRNPHRDFPAVEASRPDYDSRVSWTFTKTPAPRWSYGDGATSTVWQQHAMIEIDPHDVSRQTNLTYKLMISSTVPRPIALVSTTSVAGVHNLAPFSYFQAVCADPPLYSIVFNGEQPNDSLRNVLATKEACVSIASDWFIEALNAASSNTPPAISEWPLSGLHPVPGRFVQTPYVAEAAVSIELRYHSHQEITGKTGTRTATMVLLEAILFHIREDTLSEDRATVDISKLRPVWRGGGITYGTCLRGFELPRPVAFRNLRAMAEVQKLLDKAEEGKALRVD
ncbi:flavo protein oxygenase [Teratosphaeria nubilosa]|uniref:Flavo protein oxygenase n=1 Tax=Teratosphaeria nubilosa TaxID=161662 RepID=A0A6G1L9Y7_9PEZI|nr:flavo protein oxygenase [Teratosphaeria nubilosa]